MKLNKQMKTSSASSKPDQLAAAVLAAQVASDEGSEGHLEEAFPINLLPTANHFIAANKVLDERHDGYASDSVFQNYIALIAICVQRGHRSIVDIVAQVAPLVGAHNAPHVPWLIEILSGPACDAHLWDWEGFDKGGCFYGPTIELKTELASRASTYA